MLRPLAVIAALLPAASLGCSALLDSGPMQRDGDALGDPHDWDFPADDAAPDRPDGPDLQDLPDDAPDPADIPETVDPEDAEPETIDPCTVEEICNGQDDDGDGSIDEGCSMSLKFTDGSPPPNTWVDVIFSSDRLQSCVHLIITPPSGNPFIVEESINGYFLESVYKWNFQVELPDETGAYAIDVHVMDACPSTCDCETFSIMQGTLRVDGSTDGCNDADDDLDGRVDENCVGSIRFTDLYARHGDMVDIVVTNDSALPCIHLLEQDPCASSRDIWHGMDTGEDHEPYTVWDYTLVLPDHGGEYKYTFYHQDCSEACDCTETEEADAFYFVCGPSGC